MKVVCEMNSLSKCAKISAELKRICTAPVYRGGNFFSRDCYSDVIDAACALQSQIQISSLFLSHKRWLVSTFFFCYTGRTLEKPY
ncbi:hypothetical protein IMY05_008G0118200 [Salix suchowensis]|nr:hypothetical protein IMY05_008G0118200 [Salix suchowensis]